ncbi:MAG: hypothetical protein HYZ31_13415 [Gammaproteobacteria bacterium]|nr:hypothetical protein [Gammaproteobacteria bacterium]
MAGFVHFRWLVAVFLSVSLLACGSGDNASSVTDDKSSREVTVFKQEGSVDPITGFISPMDITNLLPHRGTALAGGDSYYVVRGLLPFTRYTISVYDPTQDVTLYGYGIASYYYHSCSSYRSGLVNEACEMSANATGEIYIRVSAYAASADAAFSVDILPLPVNEGVKTAPLEIGNRLPYAGTVQSNGNSYYVVSGLVPGQKYDVRLNNVISYPTLNGYPHKDFINPGNYLCWSRNDGWADEYCQLAANFEGKLYLNVSDYSYYVSGSYYTINVTAAAGSERYFEGYADAPVIISGSSYSGQSYRYPSYYRFTGLIPGQRYEIHASNYTSSTDVSVFLAYSDTVGTSCSAFSYYAASNDTWCVARADSRGEFNVRINGADNQGGTVFQVSVSAAPVAQGTQQTPVTVTLPFSGQVDSTRSYYVVTGLQPNYVYAVTTSSTTRNLYVYAGTSFGSMEHSFTGRTNAAGELYVTAATGYEDGAWFSFALGSANNPEGKITSPLNISASSETTPHVGQVDNTASYYVVNGLTPGRYYMTHLNGVSSVRPTLEVFTDNTFTTPACVDSYLDADEEGRCLAAANTSGSLYLRVTNNTYMIEGSRYNLWLAPSFITSEGSEQIPVNIDPAGRLNYGEAVSYQGKVSADFNRSVSYYRVTLNMGPANYTVMLNGMSDDVDLDVINHLTKASSTDFCISKHSGLLDEYCVIQTQPVKGRVKSVDLLIKVSTPTQTINYWDGAAFTLTVTPGGKKAGAEGTTTAPKDITGALPYQGLVDHYQKSYYKITGLTPGVRYEVRADSDRDKLALGVYSLLPTNYPLCSIEYAYAAAGTITACEAVATSAGELLVSVESNNMYSTATHVPFQLSIKPATQAEGQYGAPLDISGTFPRASQVGGTLDANGYFTQGSVNSYYRVSGLQANTYYQVFINHQSRTLYRGALKVYRDYGMSQPSCDEGAFLLCRALSSENGDLYIHVDGYADRNSSGAYFDLNVRLMPVSEGSQASPLVIGKGVSQRQYAGLPAASYYKVTGLTPYMSQQIQFQKATGYTQLTLFGSAAYQYQLCDMSSQQEGGCSAAANSQGELYLKIQSDEMYKYGADAGTFELTIH